MNKKRYHIHITHKSPLMLNALNVYQISELACSSDYEVLPHRQWCYEIACVVEGNGVFRRNDKDYEVSAGKLFVLSKEDLHSLRSSKSHPLRFTCLGFTFNKNHADYPKYTAIADFFENPAEPVADDLHRTADVLSAALSEAYSSAEQWQEMMYTYLLQVIIGTYRSFHQTSLICHKDLVSADTTNPVIYEMTRYVDQNLTSMKSLQEMAKELGYSYSYLSRLFSATMGSTLREYSTQRRFEKALQLLREPYTLAEIAQQLGFSDAANFSRAFKKQYHLSPGEYRRKQ